MEPQDIRWLAESSADLATMISSFVEGEFGPGNTRADRPEREDGSATIGRYARLASDASRRCNAALEEAATFDLDDVRHYGLLRYAYQSAQDALWCVQKSLVEATPICSEPAVERSWRNASRMLLRADARLLGYGFVR